MQRIKIYKMATAIGFFILHLGAHGQERILSVNDYIHDINSAKYVTKTRGPAYEAEVARLASNPQAMVKFINTESPVTNASKALEKIHVAYEFKRPLSKCFGGQNFSAATTEKTDHACVDAAGFKR